MILTASFDLTVGEACRRLGVRNLVASEVDVGTMKVTYLNFSTNKAKRFRELYGPDVVIDEFYTDSKFDQPMIDMARHAFMVKGNTNHASQVGNNRKQHNVTNNERGTYMSMPLDLYVIRHGESEAKRHRPGGRAGRQFPVHAGQRHRTRPLLETHRHRTQQPTASAAGWSASSSCSTATWSRHTCAPAKPQPPCPAQGQMGGEPCAA